jgi:hypothetical protein
MFVPAPIDKNFVPHTRRPVLRRNAGLFVDAGAGGNAGISRVVPQSRDCAGRPDGAPCGPHPSWGMICVDGECVFPYR